MEKTIEMWETGIKSTGHDDWLNVENQREREWNHRRLADLGHGNWVDSRTRNRERTCGGRYKSDQESFSEARSWTHWLWYVWWLTTSRGNWPFRRSENTHGQGWNHKHTVITPAPIYLLCPHCLTLLPPGLLQQPLNWSWDSLCRLTFLEPISQNSPARRIFLKGKSNLVTTYRKPFHGFPSPLK